MSASNSNMRKKVDGLTLYTNEMYYKSYPGKPTTNLIPTASSNSDFSARVGSTPNAFYRIYKDKDPDKQGMYKSLATGTMSSNDVVYKYSGWSDEHYGGSGVSNKLHGLHSFAASDFPSLKLRVGQEYIFSCEVFVSKTHGRTEGFFPVISATSTDQNGRHYGYYDFSKTGTWQVVSVVFVPTLKSLVTATAGTAGTAGTSGTSGIVRTLNHTMYFWPNEGTTSDSQRQYGYMLYKNPQLETGNKRTQFTRNSDSRKSANSLKDISGNKNSLSVINNFDDSSLPIYSKGKFSNLGLTSTASGFASSFNTGSTNKKSYEFWVNLKSVNEGVSTLLYSDVARGSSLFVSKESVSRKQHVYVEKGKIYCTLYNELGVVFSAYTDRSEILNSNLYHIVVSIDMTKSSDNKVTFYVNGEAKPSSTMSEILPPANVRLNLFPSNSSKLAVGNILAYRISSYNADGESMASALKTIYVKSTNQAVRITWSNVRDAFAFSVYKSVNYVGSEMSNKSLLSFVGNPNFDNATSTNITYEDDGTVLTGTGRPKPKPDFDKYDALNTSFYDGSDLKLSIGDYPRRAPTLVTGESLIEKTGAEGKIYQVSVYNRSLSSGDVLNNYIQSLSSFNVGSSSADYSFSASSGTSTGGYGGGY